MKANLYKAIQAMNQRTIDSLRSSIQERKKEQEKLEQVLDTWNTLVPGNEVRFLLDKIDFSHIGNHDVFLAEVSSVILYSNESLTLKQAFQVYLSDILRATKNLILKYSRLLSHLISLTRQCASLISISTRKKLRFLIKIIDDTDSSNLLTNKFTVAMNN